MSDQRKILSIHCQESHLPKHYVRCPGKPAFCVFYFFQIIWHWQMEPRVELAFEKRDEMLNIGNLTSLFGCVKVLSTKSKTGSKLWKGFEKMPNFFCGNSIQLQMQLRRAYSTQWTTVMVFALAWMFWSSLEWANEQFLSLLHKTQWTFIYLKIKGWIGLRQRGFF